MNEALVWNIGSWLLLLGQAFGFTGFLFSSASEVKGNFYGFRYIFWVIFLLSWLAVIIRVFSRKGPGSCFALFGILGMMGRMLLECRSGGFKWKLVVGECIFIPGTIFALLRANWLMKQPKLKDQ